jgi:hypothetical protein
MKAEMIQPSFGNLGQEHKCIISICLYLSVQLVFEDLIEPSIVLSWRDLRYITRFYGFKSFKDLTPSEGATRHPDWRH